MVQRIPASGLTGIGGNFKNLLINGDYLVWQRGTAAATVTDSSTTCTYLADRWGVWEDTGGTITQEQSALDNDDFETTGQRNALLVKCTGTDSSIGAAEFAMITQVIEAQNCQGLKWGTDNAEDVTLTFWVKSNLTGTFNAVIRKPDSTFYYIPKEYTINSANTWEKKTITYGPGDTNGSVITASTGDIANDNGEGIWVQFNLAVGSNFHGTAGTWANAVTGLGTSNQTNFMSSTSNNFYLTGVQLEAGSGASDFEHIPRDVTEMRCLRYFVRQKSNDTASNFYAAICSGIVSGLAQVTAYAANPVMPRTERSIAYTSNVKIYGGLAEGSSLSNFTITSMAFYDGTFGCMIQPGIGSNDLTTQQTALLYFVNDANAYFDFDCEFNSGNIGTASGGS
jgi:hypothetical protein